eukprot:TRINITY_DN25058_c0_g1_i1.p1 TRINITY_DN25058_c0_g1~~TRINITY_DN25058_c0_g1_i1.p1  ORF type:complete len:414 (+),score=37.50 TRINITY_DN25058_c0_g1_i1:349-1590(+)
MPKPLKYKSLLNNFSPHRMHSSTVYCDYNCAPSNLPEHTPTAADYVFRFPWAVWCEQWHMVNGAPELMHLNQVATVCSLGELSVALQAANLEPLHLLSANRSVHCFVGGLTPSYADAGNRRGGHFTLYVTDTATAAKMWRLLTLAAATAGSDSAFPHPELAFANHHADTLAGVTLLRKPHYSAVKLWVRDTTRPLLKEIRLAVVRLLELPSPRVKFSPHRFVLYTLSRRQENHSDQQKSAQTQTYSHVAAASVSIRHPTHDYTDYTHVQAEALDESSSSYSTPPYSPTPTSTPPATPPHGPASFGMSTSPWIPNYPARSASHTTHTRTTPGTNRSEPSIAQGCFDEQYFANSSNRCLNGPPIPVRSPFCERPPLRSNLKSDQSYLPLCRFAAPTPALRLALRSLLNEEAQRDF